MQNSQLLELRSFLDLSRHYGHHVEVAFAAVEATCFKRTEEVQARAALTRIGSLSSR
jgi:hypothetical protein